MDAQVMSWMTFCSSGLLGNKQPLTKVAFERRIMKVCFVGCNSSYWWNWLDISSITIGLYHIVCILYFDSAAFRMDGAGPSWMMLTKALPHRYKQLPQVPDLQNAGLFILYTCIWWKLYILELLRYNIAHFSFFRVHGALASGWMPDSEFGWHVWSCRQTDANFWNILKTTEIEQGEEGNTTLTMVKYPNMITLQLLTCTCIRSWLKVVEKVFLFSKLKNISFQQLVSKYNASYGLPTSIV